MDVSAERIETHADAAQTANGGKRKRPDQDTTSPARPRTVLEDQMIKQKAIALALQNIKSFTEMGLDTTALKRDLQSLSAVGEPQAAAGPRAKPLGPLEKFKKSGQPVKVASPPKEPVGAVRVEEAGSAALGKVREPEAGVDTAEPPSAIPTLAGLRAHAGAAGMMAPEFRAWGGPTSTEKVHGAARELAKFKKHSLAARPRLNKPDKKLFAVVVLINQITQEAPDWQGAVRHKLCWLGSQEEDPGKLGGVGRGPVRPAAEDTSVAGKMWRKGELVAEGVPTEDVFSVLAAVSAKESLFYTSRQGLKKALNGDALQTLVKNGWLSQWEVLYARQFHDSITNHAPLMVFYFAEENFLCCCKSRVISKTQVRTAARDPQSGEVWECRCRRAVQAFASLGVPLRVSDAGIMLTAMIETLDASFRFVMPGLCKEVWDLPRYLGPGEAPLPAPVAEAAVEPGAADGQINKDAQGVAGGGSREGGVGQAVGAVGAAVASAADGLPTSLPPPVAHSDDLPAVASAAVASAAVAIPAVASAAVAIPAVASAAVAIPAVASAAVAIPAVASAADGLPTSASLA
ncbi:hypothetical protein T484DRAFT_1861420 [Baffinella frigidus]|nr:hypothetical protein T484DRAFT_1861420 [Cryptophyta sp. CCMP2293]